MATPTATLKLKETLMTADKPATAKIRSAMAQFSADLKVAAESASKKFAELAAATKRS